MRVWFVLLLFAGLANPVNGSDEVDYQRDVKPLLTHKCGACHGSLKQEAGLRLDHGRLIRRGGEGGPVVVAGDASESELIRRVSAVDLDERMPPDGLGEPLTKPQIALLENWIRRGAKVPEEEPIPDDPRAHWSYRLPERPALPPVIDPGWSHPIDRFVSREHRRLGLEPANVADKHTLLRRVYLDLIGLPPSRNQLRTFLEDESTDTWESVVDSLLENPHYGERWGRHWMDVWRYSDWDGYKQELRGSQRHIWRWRDWIIRSLNQDKGYDRMIVEMLAADEVAPKDLDALSATGFLARNFHKSNRNIWLDATVEHTAKAFLGLTINCARCHDHKYDPIPQLAYYEFRAIFEPHRVRLDQIPGQLDLSKDGLARAFDADLTAKTFVFLQGNDKQPDEDHPVLPAVPEVLGGSFAWEPVPLPVDAYFPALRDYSAEGRLAAARKQVSETQLALANAMEQGGDASRPGDSDIEVLECERNVAQLRVHSLQLRADADRARFAEDDQLEAKRLANVAARVERQLVLREAELAARRKRRAVDDARSAANTESSEQDADKKRAAIQTAKKELAEAQKNLKAAREALLKKADEDYTPLGEEYPRTSSGRRLALARWIANRSNPLTARVAVNHVWMRHFGAPLVENVFDFGLRSPLPRHAELLDWLAVELMENNWSLKHLHRLIVKSRTWRLASSGTSEPTARETPVLRNRSIDRDNHYLWRMNVRRLDAEIIRDNVLAVSDQLDETLGGKEIDFRQGEISRRRSIYLRHAYEKQMTMLVLFDAASPNECYRRSESIVPQQALAMTNSSLSLGQSRLLARRLWQEVVENGERAEADFVRETFLKVLSRPPLPEELDACLRFLAEQTATLSDTSVLTTFVGGDAPKVKPAEDPRHRALENLVHVLINHNDFVTVR